MGRRYRETLLVCCRLIIVVTIATVQFSKDFNEIALPIQPDGSANALRRSIRVTCQFHVTAPADRSARLLALHRDRALPVTYRDIHLLGLEHRRHHEVQVMTGQAQLPVQGVADPRGGTGPGFKGAEDNVIGSKGLDTTLRVHQRPCARGVGAPVVR